MYIVLREADKETIHYLQIGGSSFEVKAKEKGFPGLMLETQDNNVAACRLYARCGFELRGFDTHLYKALDPSSDEIALYWYLIF